MIFKLKYITIWPCLKCAWWFCTIVHDETVCCKMTWPTLWKCIHMYLKMNIYNREKMYIVNVQVYRIHVCFRIILIFFQLGKLLTPTLKNIQNPESCKTLVTMSWAGAAPGALEAVGRSPSVQRESALAAPRSRESERTFWEWLDDLRIGVDYPGGDHLGRVSGAGLSVRDVSRSRLSLVLRSLVRKSTWLMRPPTLSRKRTKNYTVFDWLDQIPCWGTLYLVE